MSPVLTLPPLHPSCSLTVTIPARDEEREITSTLTALASQRDLRDFDVVVFANNCSDGTASRARRVGERFPGLRFHLIEDTLADSFAHVGWARKALMDAAADRFLRAGRPRGVVTTTDADTVVAPDWVERTIAEMDKGVDAVGGFVEIKQSERLAMDPLYFRLTARDADFRAAVAQVEALIDPRPEDPWPRHCSFVAASFAVSAELYRRAGGLPAVPSLEDQQFAQALRRIDARIRFSLDVRAWTSGRRQSRVTGGFATFINHLYGQSRKAESFDVEHPDGVLREFYARAALRKLWESETTPSDLEAISRTIGISVADCLRLGDDREHFGAAFERIMTLSKALRTDYPMVPVEQATARYRDEIAKIEAAKALDRKDLDAITF
jgi:hypothetical protein